MVRGLAAAVALLCVACGGVTLPDAAPDVEGTVQSWDVPFPGSNSTNIDIFVGGLGCVHETFLPEDTEFGLRRSDGSVTQGSYRDLEVGQPIRVWTTSQVEVCAVGSTAAAVEIVAG